ncbi:MAG: hypothetical protein M3380_06160 [Chloroflexota bacterium]|nr:hypothetical protein [Chloroflexota bacterium]
MNPDGTGHRALQDGAIAAEGTVLHLQGYGMIQVFRIVTPHGDTEDWATNVVTMTPLERECLAGEIWTIEGYHRRLKQFCGWSAAKHRPCRRTRLHARPGIKLPS